MDRIDPHPAGLSEAAGGGVPQWVCRRCVSRSSSDDPRPGPVQAHLPLEETLLHWAGLEVPAARGGRALASSLAIGAQRMDELGIDQARATGIVVDGGASFRAQARSIGAPASWDSPLNMSDALAVVATQLDTSARVDVLELADHIRSFCDFDSEELRARQAEKTRLEDLCAQAEGYARGLRRSAPPTARSATGFRRPPQ